MSLLEVTEPTITATQESESQFDGVEQTAPDWKESLPEKYRDASFVTKYGDSQEDFLNGMDNLTKMIGSRKSDIPDFDTATDEELGAFREKLGVPTAKDGYNIDTPEGFEANDEYNSFIDMAHKNNISNEGANELFKMHSEAIGQMNEAIEQRKNAERSQAFEEFYKNPKAIEMEAQTEEILKAIDPAGMILKAEDIASFGVNAPKVIQLLSEINTKMFASDRTPSQKGTQSIGGSRADQYASIRSRVSNGTISQEQGNSEIHGLDRFFS